MSFSDWIRHIGSWFSDLSSLGVHKCVYGPPERFRVQEIDEDMLEHVTDAERQPREENAGNQDASESEK